MTLYGPPPDPAQQLIAVPPVAWAISLAVGVLAVALGLLLVHGRTTARGRPGAGTCAALGLLTLGGTALLTAPMLGMVPVAVIGSYPTIDKAGSLHFFREGVHWRLFDPDDAGVQLIGVHLGHLWVVEAFSAILPDWASFNAESLLNLWLSWWCMTAWLRHRCGDLRAAVLLGVPFALNLHQLRDVNWYTVEKTAVFLLPLWLLCVERRLRAGCFFVGALAMSLNVYMGVLIAAMGAWWAAAGVAAASGRLATPPIPALGGSRDPALATLIQCVAATAVGMLPLVAWQAVLMRGAHAPGSPELFLSQRAALDVFSVVPLEWNRLEGWRALNLGVLGLALVWAYGEVAWRRSGARLGAILLFTLLALGPTGNPLYLALFEVVPGFWRVAKPETFFWVTWLLLVTSAAEVLASARLTNRAMGALAALLLAGWLWGVRTHPVYPDFFSAPPSPAAPRLDR